MKTHDGTFWWNYIWYKVGTKQMQETYLIEGKYLRTASDFNCRQLVSSRVHHVTTGDMERNRLIVLCGFDGILWWNCDKLLWKMIVSETCMFVRLQANPECDNAGKDRVEPSKTQGYSLLQSTSGKKYIYMCVGENLFGIALIQYAKWGLMLIELKTLCLCRITYP